MAYFDTTRDYLGLPVSRKSLMRRTRQLLVKWLHLHLGKCFHGHAWGYDAHRRRAFRKCNICHRVELAVYNRELSPRGLFYREDGTLA
jgi:hypothetical protein